MVTLYYLRRYGLFSKTKEATTTTYALSVEMLPFFEELKPPLHHMPTRWNPFNRMKIVGRCPWKSLPTTASKLHPRFLEKRGKRIEKLHIFSQHSNFGRRHPKTKAMTGFINRMDIDRWAWSGVDYLAEMLEGQVAVLSAQYLNQKKRIFSVYESKLYREDQQVYTLYQQNPSYSSTATPTRSGGQCRLVSKPLKWGEFPNPSRWRSGFNETSKCQRSHAALEALPENSVSSRPRSEHLSLALKSANRLCLTGRSGFHGYEGLGSIYWHMVSKLASRLWSVDAIETNADEAIIAQLNNTTMP